MKPHNRQPRIVRPVQSHLATAVALRNVARCRACGYLVEQPCRACAARRVAANERLAREVRLAASERKARER